ncbi:MAG: dual specificity protein phosphatase family protein [Planctomycetota bacterium]
MKYGILFGIVSILLIVVAISRGYWYLLCLWPAASFGIIAAGYLFLGPRVYGKSHGVLSPFTTVLLLPYLCYMWAAWYAMRFVKTEAAYDQLTEDIYIGRRLLAHEFPDFVDHVIDLTCEFTEPKPLRETTYHSFQILDGYVPDTAQLKEWLSDAANLKGVIYIHCAEGHGRTGLFAAALLVQLGKFASADEALEYVKSKRPLVRLGTRQMDTLSAI